MDSDREPAINQPVVMDKLFEIHNLRCSYDKHYRERVSKTVLHIDDLVLPKGKKNYIGAEVSIGKTTN